MNEEILEILKEKFKPYSNFVSFKELPKQGISREEIIRIIKDFIIKEDKKWKEGYISGCVYHGEDSHIAFANEVYSIASQVNPLHPDVWPSSIKFEREIIEMSKRIFNANEEVSGSVTSGGTESIFLAMKVYRDYARKNRGITEPEIILPVSAHAAFDKASKYLGINLKYVGLNDNFQANIEEIKESINQRTIGIVVSAPCFPYGTIDPIEEVSEIAYDYRIPLHVDACLGGFILPWAKKLGYEVPKFDFELEGVTSIFADLHKYGFSPKGVSLILYRDPEIWKYQFYINTRWSGGIYYSTTFQGSKPGALLIAAWAIMLYLGEEGYLKAAKQILETGSFIKSKVKEIKDIKILGNPLWVIAFSSDTLNIYTVAELMSKRGWGLNLLINPPAFHIALTLRHDLKVAERFIEDLKSSVDEARNYKKEEKGFAPIYGVVSSLPLENSEELMYFLIQWMYRDP